MSPRALQVAIDALAADVHESERFLAEAETNVDRAQQLLARGQQTVQEALERLEIAREALEYLESLQQPQEPTDSPIGAEVDQ